MKKKLSYLLVALLLFVVSVPMVFAASATTKITGTNTIKVGNTTKIYIKLNASSKIEGVDVTYKTSGNIKVTNVSIGSGLSKMGQNGNRYILYAQNPIKSGSTVLTLTVKGTAVGKGTVTVSKMEATVSGVTVYGGSKSYDITITEKQTEEEKKAAEEKAKKAAEEKAKKEAEEKRKEKDALALVEKAEKTLDDSDYEKAQKAVNALTNASVKKDLQKRLDEVKFKIAVKKECGKKTCDGSAQECNCESGNGNCNKKPWIILCIILTILIN